MGNCNHQDFLRTHPSRCPQCKQYIHKFQYPRTTRWGTSQFHKSSCFRDTNNLQSMQGIRRRKIFWLHIHKDNHKCPRILDTCQEGTHHKSSNHTSNLLGPAQICQDNTKTHSSSILLQKRASFEFLDIHMFAGL